MNLRAATAILKLRDRHTQVLALGLEVPSPAHQKLCSMPQTALRLNVISGVGWYSALLVSGGV